MSTMTDGIAHAIEAAIMSIGLCTAVGILFILFAVAIRIFDHGWRKP